MLQRTRDGLANILLVEDNAGDVVLFQEAFDDAGVVCHIDVLPDGEAALAHVQRRVENGPEELPDLIVMDLNLPKLNGCEVLQALKADLRLRCIPVLVLSSSQAPRDIERSYQSHASAYLCKPVDLGMFVELARMIDSFWLRTVLRPNAALPH